MIRQCFLHYLLISTPIKINLPYFLLAIFTLILLSFHRPFLLYFHWNTTIKILNFFPQDSNFNFFYDDKKKRPLFNETRMSILGRGINNFISKSPLIFVKCLKAWQWPTNYDTYNQSYTNLNRSRSFVN